MKTQYELIIIGGGPAGMTAAIYAARRKVDTLLVTKIIGGQTAWSADIENYLGFNMISGPELVTKFYQHVKAVDDDNATYDLDVLEGAEAVGLQNTEKETWQVTLADGQTTAAKAVIIAAGKVPRMLKVKGEDKFLGKGVTFCATCDAPLYRGKSVAVVGGGNSALDAALQLAKLCPQVYVINVNSELKGEQVMVEHVKKFANITVLSECETVEIIGDSVVRGLKLKHKTSGQEEVIEVQGVFEEIGYEPATAFLKGIVKLNNYHEIEIDSYNHASVPGIFAAGDITNVSAKQIIVAAGEGAKAALQAHAFLRGQKPGA